MAINSPITNWQGKTAWLVGASTGIGQALAQDLSKQGATLAVSARESTALRACAAATNAQALPLDVTDVQSLQTAHAQIKNPLDFVLFCAGTYKPMRTQDFDLAELKRQLDVNYVGALNLLSVVLPPMLKRGAGHISLVSSVAGYKGLPKSLAYGPSKAALTHLAQTLHMDLVGTGVQVSVVSPGFVATPLTQQNDFHMPALLTPQQASAAMLEGYADGDFEIHFPKRFSRSLKLLGLLPDALYFKMVKKATGL